MIIINNSAEYLTLSINEAYKKNGEVWDKALVLRFPASDFSFDEAVQIAEKAETVTNVTKDEIFEYSVTGIVDKKAKSYCIDIWLNNPDVTITDNLAEKLIKAEEQLVQVATEKQINEAIAEGVNSIDS